MSIFALLAALVWLLAAFGVHLSNVDMLLLGLGLLALHFGVSWTIPVRQWRRESL